MKPRRSHAVASLVLIASTVSFSADEESRHFIQVDPDFAMGSGAETLLTVHRFTQIGDDRCIGDIDFGKHGWRRVGSMAARGIKALLLDRPLASWLMLTQHEMFGHAARAREFDFSDISIRVSVPWPYGDGTGEVGSTPRADTTQQEHIAVTAAGMQATGLLAHRLAFKWIEKNSIDHREALLYLTSYHDATNYVRELFTAGIDPSARDPRTYVDQINTLYAPQEVLDLGQLQDRVLVNLIDSFTWLAGWSELRYLWSGERRYAFKMIPSGPVEWLPGARLGLTPFGTEYVLNSYILYRKRVPGYIYVRFGQEGGDDHSGIGIEARKVYRRGRFGLDAKVDLWRQPRIDAQPEDLAAGIAGRTNGGALTLRGHFDMSRRYGMMAEAGVKSSGFLVGEPLADGLFVRFAFGILGL
jgi:hypothetical protein